MTIEEQLKVLNGEFQKLHSKFMSFDTQLKGIDSKYAALKSSIVSKYQSEKQRQIDLKEEILKYYRIAKDNSYKDISPSAPAKMPNIGTLNNLIDRINTLSRNDNIAGQIIDLASGYLSFVENELKKVISRENNELSALEGQKTNEIAQINNSKKQVLVDCKNYLKSETMIALVQLFEMIHRDYEITPSYFSNWKIATQRKRMMLFGFQQFAIDAPRVLLGDLKQSLGNHFDENTKMVNCPCGYTTDSYEIINAEYVDQNERELAQGIQALILNILRYFKPTEYKITLLDYIHYNSEILGPLYGLANGKKSIVDEVAYDEKSLEQQVSVLASFYRKIESVLGASTVHEYNRNPKNTKKIPLRLLIINRAEQSFKSDKPEMSYLLNNAAKFGLTIINMTRSVDGGSKGKTKEKNYTVSSNNVVQIISDSNGKFYIKKDDKWLSYKWMTSPSSVPSEFVANVLKATTPVEIGTKFFKRYKVNVPTKSTGPKRKPISIPFAIDENDNVINCNFENETFAAYIMGAAGSGKSTLLHTIISGILMNYHPDEVELWLLDFKMLEFKRYVKNRPPHVKYLLLEKSEDLVFDILDQLTNILAEREYLFAQRGWSKLTDVPSSENIPAIFVIIDEFAQMSQILKETKGNGYGSDYTITLENLLAKGRALGMKFIFASQTYTTGISGLTETACKQIQMRFAMKNTPDEIKQTLTISSNEITSEISQWISSLPAYETLFKWSDSNNRVRIGRFRNMYTEDGEIESLIQAINSEIKPLPKGSATNDKTYIDKKSVLIDGGEPKTFKSQIQAYKDYESSIDKDNIDENDTLIYAGVPCSFNLARPFLLCNGMSENILIAGGDRENKMSILLSIMNSYMRTGNPIEIWAHDRSATFKKYRNTVLSKRKQITDLEGICGEISELKAKVQKRQLNGKLIAILGYELLRNDMEILGEDADEYDIENDEPETPEVDYSAYDMNELVNMFKEATSEEEKEKIRNYIQEYNSGVAASKPKKEVQKKKSKIYDAHDDIEWLIKRASNYGVHFVFCFEQAKDFLSLRLDEKSFQHKILFAMAKDESMSIMNNRKANELEGGTCVYSDGKDMFTLRPHLYRGVPLNGWMIDYDGKIIQRR